MLLSKKNFIESKCLFESSFWEIPFREILNFEPFDIFVNGLDETNFSQNFFQRSICLFLYLFMFLFYIFFFFIFLFCLYFCSFFYPSIYLSLRFSNYTGPIPYHFYFNVFTSKISKIASTTFSCFRAGALV